MAAMTPSRLPRIRRDSAQDDEDTPFLDLPEPPPEPLPSDARSSIRSFRQAIPGAAQAPSSPQRARFASAPGAQATPAPGSVQGGRFASSLSMGPQAAPNPGAQSARFGRTPTPGPTSIRQTPSEARPSLPRPESGRGAIPPTSGGRAPASGVAAQSLRDPIDDDDDISSRSAYSLRARDLPLSVARRSAQPARPGEATGRRVEDTAVEKPPRPPSRPAEGGALPLARPPGPAISPRMTAIFGGLFGLAAITSVVAVLIQAAPPRNDREKMAEPSATSTAGAAAANAADAPARPKKPKREALPSPWRIKEMEKDPAVTLVSGVMAKKSFIDALDEKKVPKAQAYRIMKAFDAVRKFDHCGKKDRFTVALEKGSMRVKAFEYEVGPTEIYQAREDAQGLLSGAKLDMKIAENEFAGAFYVQKDVSKSYEEGGFESGILGSIDEALVGRMSCDSFDEGGTVRVIALEETALGLFARYKRVLALEYIPPGDKGKPMRIYYFSGGQSKGYWDDRGKQMYGGGFQKPVPGPITSPFNPKRMHPVLHTIMPHQGTDIGVPSGTPILASYKGTIQFVGNGGPAGNLVTILHANGVETGYAHMSRFVPGMKIGDKVATKQLVGYVGSTGRSTGPHLHFSAKKNGQFFDAMTLLAIDKERVMPPEDRQAFMTFKAEMDRRLDAIPLPIAPPAPPAPPSPPPSPSRSPPLPAPPRVAPPRARLSRQAPARRLRSLAFTRPASSRTATTTTTKVASPSPEPPSAQAPPHPARPEKPPPTTRPIRPRKTTTTSSRRRREERRRRRDPRGRALTLSRRRTAYVT